MRADNQPKSRRSKGVLQGAVGVVYRVALIALALPIVLILLYKVVPPVSTLMLGRWLTLQSAERSYLPLGSISPSLVRAVVNSEDSRFCLHRGVDWDALQEVMDDADGEGPSRGASTIAMQTAKNVFLWPGRSYIRKGLEIPLALVIDAVWGKARVMEVYLNVAEWGDGIFGAEAAARRYFHKSAATLAPREAAALAAVLPNPLRFSPVRPSAYIARRTARILQRMANEDVSCLPRSNGR